MASVEGYDYPPDPKENDCKFCGEPTSNKLFCCKRCKKNYFDDLER